MNFGPDFRKLFRYLESPYFSENEPKGGGRKKKKKKRKRSGLISNGMEKNPQEFAGLHASINRQNFASLSFFDFFSLIGKYCLSIYIHILVNPYFIFALK